MRLFVHLLLSCALLICMVMNAPSYADSNATEKSKQIAEYKKQYPHIDPIVIEYAVEQEMKPDVVDKILKEVEKQKFSIFEDYDVRIAYDAHEDCKMSAYSNFYHCVCTAVNYVEIIRQNGGEGMYGAWLGAAQKKCPYVESVANLSYIECMKGMSMAPESLDFDAKAYCECYANRYARQFELKPLTARADRYYMRSQAHAYCRNNYNSQNVIEIE